MKKYCQHVKTFIRTTYGASKKFFQNDTIIQIQALSILLYHFIRKERQELIRDAKINNFYYCVLRVFFVINGVSILVPKLNLGTQLRSQSQFGNKEESLTSDISVLEITGRSIRDDRGAIIYQVSIPCFG